MKEKIKKIFVTLFKNPLWIIVILLVVMIFLLLDISQKMEAIEYSLWKIDNVVRGIYQQIGFKPDIGEIWKDTLENKLIEIQSKIQQIYNSLRY